jgi:GAF domain-containing protein
MLTRLTNRLDRLYREREERYRAGVLLMVLGISVAGNLLFPLSLVLAARSMTPAQHVAVLASTLGALLNVAVGFVLLYMGHRRLAAWVFLLIQWAMVILLSIPFGLSGGWAAVVPMVIVMAGLVLSWQGTLALAALFVAGMVAAGLLQVYNIPPTPPATGDEIILHLGLAVGATLVTGSVVSVLSGQIARLMEESLSWIRRMHAVFAVGRSVSTITGLKEMLLAVIERIQEGFDFYHAQILLVKEDGHKLTIQASTAPDIQQLLREFDPPTVGEESVIGQAALGRAVVVNDVAASPLFRPEKHFPHTQSEAALPMMTGGRVLGVLDVMSASPNVFSSESVRALQALANQVAVAIQTTSEAAPESAVLEALDPILSASRDIMTAPDAEAIVEVLHGSVLAPFDHISLVQVRYRNPGEATLEELAVWDRDGAAPGSETPVELCEAADEEALILLDVFNLPEAWVPYQPFLRDHLALGSVGIFPLRGRARPVGYLLVGKRQPYVFSDREHRTLLALSVQIALLLENKLLQQEFEARSERVRRLNAFIETVSTTSSMTQLYHVLTTHIAGVIDYQYLSLALLEPDGPALRMVQLRSPDGHPGPLEAVSPPDAVIERALGERQAVIVGDVMDLPESDVWLMAGVRSLAAAPLVMEGVLLGALIVGREETNTFVPQEAALLERMALQVAIAIQNIRLLEQTQTSVEDIATLLFASQHMAGAGTPENVILALSEILANKDAVDRVVIFQGRPEDTYPPSFFEVAALWSRSEELGQPDMTVGDRIPRDDFPFLLGGQNPNEAILFAPIETDARLDEPARTALSRMAARAAFRLPIKREQHWFGEALLISCGGVSFSPTEMYYYQAIADQAALALESARLVDRLSASVVEATTLYSTSLSVSVARNIDEIVEVALSQFVTLNDAARGYLYLAHPDPARRREAVRLAAWWEGGQIHWPETESYVAPASVPVLGQVPLVDEYYVFNEAVDDEQLNEAVREAFRARGVGAAVILHLSAGPDWMGSVILESGEGQMFSENAIELCRGIADICGLALNLQTALHRSRRMATQEQTLRLISDRIRSAPDVESVLRIAVEELGQALNMKEGAARLKGGGNG